MPYREVEDVVDYGDDELNMARQVIPQAQATRQEDSSMNDRSLAKYREQDDYELDSQDGGSQDGSYPDYDAEPNYDAEPDVTGNESPSSNGSNVDDAFCDQFVDYETYAQDASARHLSSDEGDSDDDTDRSEEEYDSESDSQNGKVRYRPSDASGPDENMLGAPEHRGNDEDAEDAYDSDSQDTSVRYPPSDSDEDMLASSRRFDSHENADLDNDLYELARPLSPMSTDAGSESNEDRRAPSPMNTDPEAEDIDMTETATGKAATSFHSEMSEMETYPVMSDDLSETAAQRVPPLIFKSQISPFDITPSSPPQAAYPAPANPKFVIDFGVDTNDLAPLQPDTDMSEAPLQAALPEAQDTMQHQPEPAPQCTKEEVAVTDPAPQTNQDALMDRPADTKTAPASAEKPAALEVLPFLSTFHFETKKSPTVASPALQSFDPSAWATSFNLAPQEPVEERQHSAATNDAGPSEKDGCIGEQRLPENKPCPPTEAGSAGKDKSFEKQPLPEPMPSRPSSYKDAGTQTDQTTSSAQAQTPQQWAATDTLREAERKRKHLAAMEALAVREAAWQDKNDAVTAKFQTYLEQLKAERAERVARHAKSRAERAKRHAEIEARHAEWDKTRAERDERLLKAQEDLVHCVIKGHTRMVTHLARMEAFYAKMDGYEPPDFLNERIKELLARPSGRSEEVQKIVDEAEAAVAEWNARYEAHVAKVEDLGEKIEAVKL